MKTAHWQYNGIIKRSSFKYLEESILNKSELLWPCFINEVMNITVFLSVSNEFAKANLN